MIRNLSHRIKEYKEIINKDQDILKDVREREEIIKMGKRELQALLGNQ